MDDVLISVDTECSGPSPSTGSLIAIGACRVDNPSNSFYVEIWPVPEIPWSEEAQAVHGLAKERLLDKGKPPKVAMWDFYNWIERSRRDGRPVFIAANATFDWMFVADYFHRFIDKNPFGISGADSKSLYYGKLIQQGKVPKWSDTTKRAMKKAGIRWEGVHTHNALDDAKEQADLISVLLKR